MIEGRVSEGEGKKNKRCKRKIPNSISFGLRSWKDLWLVIVSLRSSGSLKGNCRSQEFYWRPSKNCSHVQVRHSETREGNDLIIVGERLITPEELLPVGLERQSWLAVWMCVWQGWREPESPSCIGQVGGFMSGLGRKCLKYAQISEQIAYCKKEGWSWSGME